MDINAGITEVCLTALRSSRVEALESLVLAMTPLMIRIISGQEDDKLLYYINELRRLASGGNGLFGISPSERETLEICYQRLDVITSYKNYRG